MIEPGSMSNSGVTRNCSPISARIEAALPRDGRRVQPLGAGWCSVSLLSGDCFESNSASAYLLEDVFGRRGPLERFGVVVVRRQIFLDRGDEVGHRTEHAAPDRLVGELTEPPFDQIEP